MEPPGEEGKKVYINGSGHSHDQDGHMVKTLKMFFGTKIPMILKLGKHHWGLEVYKIYINDYPGLTLTYLTARSN